MKARASYAGEYPASRTGTGENGGTDDTVYSIRCAQALHPGFSGAGGWPTAPRAQIPHERGALQEFLQGCDPGSPVAVETTGNWYWIVPRLVHARKAKLMMGMINKTDTLYARG